MNCATPINILLIEDDSLDVELFSLLVKRNNLECILTHVKDGELATNYLFQDLKQGKVVRPDLIVLDLNLPRKDGREVLKEIKQDATTASIPVLVLTTSRSRADITHCYALHANCYITKPSDLGRFNAIMKSIEEFWFRIAELPARTSKSPEKSP